MLLSRSWIWFVMDKIQDRCTLTLRKTNLLYQVHLLLPMINLWRWRYCCRICQRSYVTIGTFMLAWYVLVYVSFLFLQRPSFCPVSNMTAAQIESMSSDTLNRGIHGGAAILLETFDNKLLLTRRAAHLRTFPNVWVPPGQCKLRIHLFSSLKIRCGAFQQIPSDLIIPESKKLVFVVTFYIS